MIITLCGSTRFKDVFFNIAEELTMRGHIILMPLVYQHTETDAYLISEIEKAKPILDKLHYKKIDMSEYIVVIDVNGYIGESTKKEIEYTYKTGKLVFFLSKGIGQL